MHFLCWAQSSKYQRFSRMCCRNWRKLLWKYVLEHTIVWRNVLRPNSRTQSWKYVCGTAHRNAAFRAQQRQHRWASSQHFTHFSPRNFWLPPSVALPVDYLEHSGGVEGWVSFGGERIFEGTGSKSTSGSCKAKQSKRKPPTFHTFQSKEFLAATKRHPACAWLIWSICNRDEGVSLAGILSQPALAWDYVQEEEEAINNQQSIILMGLTQLRSKVWVLWSNIKRRRFFLLNFYPETCPQKKHTWNTS